MASSSSSVVRSTPTGPQVFISFRGSDVRNNFISFLDPALREANINVFMDKDELLGTDMFHLLKRIEESEIALVIFSEYYTSSDRCLDELAKIKERKDQERIKVIPIFYRLEPSLVKHLKGVYGDNFRDLQRNHRHQPERTQKWEEALLSIPNSIGMRLSDQSDRSYRDFINSLVAKIQTLLDYMAVRGNLKPEANRQGVSMVPAKQQERKASHQEGSMVPFMVPAKQQERTEILQGGSMVPSMVPARDLQITHIDDPQRWAWITINDHEAPNSPAIESVKMIKIYWLKIVGTITTTNLTPGTKYEAVFVVKLEKYACGWEEPVTLKLKVVQHDGDDKRVDRTENLNDYIGHNWVDILAGVFIVPPANTPATIIFTMYQYDTKFKKKGLVVKGVAIRPTI